MSELSDRQPRDRVVDVVCTGRVQGVSFRAHAAHEAVRLELAGWVRNEPDGSVALHLEGPADVVEEMLAWCRGGPPGARVDRVHAVDGTPTGAASFEIAY